MLILIFSKSTFSTIYQPKLSDKMVHVIVRPSVRMSVTSGRVTQEWKTTESTNLLYRFSQTHWNDKQLSCGRETARRMHVLLAEMCRLRF